MFKRAFSFFLIFSAALSFSSCEKQDILSSDNLLKASTSQNSSTYSGVVFENGLLSFVDQTALNRIADELSKGPAPVEPAPVEPAPVESALVEPVPVDDGFNSEPIGIDNTEYGPTIIEDTVLVRFEQQFPGYISKRAQLESTRRFLMDNDQWTNINDPDDFFVDSDVLRTFLNTNLEIKVGSSIYVVANENLIIEILHSDWGTLDMYRNGDPAYEKSPNVFFHYSNPTTTASRPQDCVGSFTALRQSNGYSFTFVPDISDSPDRVYRWDFGDGTISNDRQPTHQYNIPGSYVVILQLGSYCGGFRSSQQISTINPSPSCATAFPNDALAFTVSNVNQSFTFKLASNYTSRFTYIWDFGDGQLDIYPAANRVPEFIRHYTTSGAMTVKLYIRNSQGCVTQQNRIVNVPTSACITPGFFDRDKAFQENYLPDKKFKYKLWATNAPFYHRVGAKTKSFERRGNRWRDFRAEKISARVFGLYYNDVNGSGCTGSGYSVNKEQVERNDDKAKTNEALYDPFLLRKQSLRSAHYVIVGGRQYNSLRELEID